MNHTTSTAALALTAALLLATPAAAQEQATDYEAIVRIMRECARIADVAARVACYDNTVGAERLIADAREAPASAPPRAAPVPPRREVAAAPQPTSRAAPQTANGSASLAQPPATRGFGAETLPVPETVREQQASEVQLAVTRAESVEPGIYLLTLEDGSQWRFLDAVPMSYDPPRSGAKVDLARASLGSFLMSYADQRSVRIRRVR
jgi:hypothetical protein